MLPHTLKLTFTEWVGRRGPAKKGTALTLCDPKQVKSFTKMLRDGNISGAEKMEISEADLTSRKEEYQKSLVKTKEDLETEKHLKQRKNTKRKAEKENKNMAHKRL